MFPFPICESLLCSFHRVDRKRVPEYLSIFIVFATGVLQLQNKEASVSNLNGFSNIGKTKARSLQSLFKLCETQHPFWDVTRNLYQGWLQHELNLGFCQLLEDLSEIFYESSPSLRELQSSVFEWRVGRSTIARILSKSTLIPSSKMTLPKS